MDQPGAVPPIKADNQKANPTPLVVSVTEFRRLVGNIGKTSAFSLMRKCDVDRVKIFGRTFITVESIERLIERSTQKAPN